jgi:hypothetical protein
LSFAIAPTSAISKASLEASSTAPSSLPSTSLLSVSLIALSPISLIALSPVCRKLFQKFKNTKKFNSIMLSISV